MMSLINIISNEDVSIEGYKLNSLFACILNIVVFILQTNCFSQKLEYVNDINANQQLKTSSDS